MAKDWRGSGKFWGKSGKQDEFLQRRMNRIAPAKYRKKRLMEAQGYVFEEGEFPD